MEHILKIGDKAPAFTLPNQEGKPISLSDFLGKKICLYFYPKDNTPGCTKQACNLRDEYMLLQNKGWVVLGISPDSVESHKKFEVKFQLPFPLLADENKTVCQAYGVWRLKKMMGREYMGLVRNTFLIDDRGIIANIIKKPKVERHASEVLQAL